MMVLLLIVSYLRGTGNEPSIIGITKCTTLDTTLFILLIASGFFVTGVGVFFIKRDYSAKLLAKYPFVPGDFKCTTINAIKLPSIALIAGYFAGSLGIGAGLIVNPIIIQLGVQP